VSDSCGTDSPVPHLLKGRHQPTFLGVSGRLSISNTRDEIAERLEHSPSLRPKIAEVVARRDAAARCRPALETGLSKDIFPPTRPFPEQSALPAPRGPASVRKGESDTFSRYRSGYVGPPACCMAVASLVSKVASVDPVRSASSR
jgi:hypothetical protein